MILTCPACSTRYMLDAAALGTEGRTVRCAKCGHTWMQAPPADMPKPVDSAAEAEGAVVSPFARPKRRAGMIAGWAALAAVAAGLIGGGAYFRGSIVAAWPPAARLYSAVGLAVEPVGAGLELRNVRIIQGGNPAVPVLVVQGEVVNVTEQVRDVPLLRGALVAADQAELAHWTFAVEQPRLLPGEVVTFKTEIENPAVEAKGISITFTDGTEAAPAAGGQRESLDG